MENLENIKAGWVSISCAARVADVSRPSIYTWISEGVVRHRYELAKHQVRLEDVIERKQASNEGGDH